MIVETLRAEEERFHRTLGRGLGLLDEATAGLGDGDTLSGETAFKLYDTYGFPLDLTQDAVRAARHRGGHRRLRRGDGAAEDDGAGELVRLRPEGAGQRLARPARPAGPDRVSRATAPSELIAETLALVEGDEQVEVARAGETVSALFDATPFYAEGGGQAGDQGEAEWPGGSGVIRDTRKMAGDLHVHVLEVTAGELARGRAGPPGHRRRAARADAAEPFGGPPRPRGAAPRAGRRTSRRRASWSTPTACASTSATARR